MRRVLILFVFICLVGTSFSQGVKIGIGGGFSFVTGPKGLTESANVIGNVISGGAGFSTEYNVGAKVKLDIPLVPIKPVGFLQYHFLSSTVGTPLGDFKASMNVLSLGVGGEFALIPGPLSPYVGADITYNNFMEGKIETPFGTRVFSESGSRMGIGIGAGVELNLIVVSLDLNAKYNMLNLLAKKGDEETVGFFTVDLFLLF